MPEYKTKTPDLAINKPGSENLTKYGYVEANVAPDSDLAIKPGILDLQMTSIINHFEKAITLYAKQPVGMCGIVRRHAEFQFK